MDETLESRVARLEESVRNLKAVATYEALRRRKSLMVRLVLLAVLFAAYAYFITRGFGSLTEH